LEAEEIEITEQI
jgi:hypothetical protein